MFNLTSWKTGALATLVAAGLMLPAANAGQRRFAYSYETLTAPKGTIELENWVTFEHFHGNEDVWQFRHEIEYGVTDRFELSLYFADWQYDKHDEEGHNTRFNDVAVEGIYNLTNPNTDLIGSSLYLEVKVGEELVELEGKLLLEKRFGPLSVVYNAVLEATWEGSDLEERTGEFRSTVGVSYDITKSFSMGVEAQHEIGMPDWSNADPSRFWVGPNISVRSGRLYGTLAALWQTTGISGETSFMPRLIVGYTF